MDLAHARKARVVARPGGRILAHALVARRIDDVFSVPDESFLDTPGGLYAMRQKLRLHPVRHHPDFGKFIEAFGGHGEVVTATEEFAPAFARVVASAQPAVIELRMNPDQITTRGTIAELRAAAPNPKRAPTVKRAKPVARRKSK